MARGFESKSVADQQEAAERGPRPQGTTPGVDSGRLARKHKTELARVDILRRIERAHSQAHIEMLKRALAALDRELEELS